jgi:segregation and condensation protein B
MKLESKIEALLFFKGEPITIKNLAKSLNTTEDEIKAAIISLKENLIGRGLSIIEESDSVELRTAPEASDMIRELIKDEDTKELTKSALETLSIILYKGPISRRDIDFIRGVNSSFILRTLSSRGLVRKSIDEGKGNLYEATTELLAHLGVRNSAELPEYENLKSKMEEKVGELKQTDETEEK